MVFQYAACESDQGGGSCRVWRDNLCVEASEQNQKFRFGIYRFLLKVVHVNLIKRVGWGGVGGGGGARIPWQPVGRAFSQLTTAAFDAANNHWFPASEGFRTYTQNNSVRAGKLNTRHNYRTFQHQIQKVHSVGQKEDCVKKWYEICSEKFLNMKKRKNQSSVENWKRLTDLKQSYQLTIWL